MRADTREDELTSEVHDGEIEDAAAGAVEPDESFDSSGDETIPRHTKPFRAWGAAHEPTGPSLWARFRAWLAGLFRRNPDDDTDDEDDSATSDEFATRTSVSRPSYDDLDAPWAEPLPDGDVASQSRHVEPPSPDDFEAPWDDPYVGPEDTDAISSIAEASSDPVEAPWGEPFRAPVPPEMAATSAEPDPVWDEPRVAESSKPPREAISRGDLDFVWTPPGPDADVDLLAESRQATSPESESEGAFPKKRLSFISRLFSRKKKDESSDATEFSFGDETPSTASIDSPVSALEPAIDDFAEALPASLDAEPDAPTEVEAAAAEVEEEVEAEMEAEVEATVELPDEAVARAAGDFDVDVEVDDVDVDVEEEKAAPPPKRLSLIARLFKRKSKEEPPAESDLDAAMIDLDVVEPQVDSVEAPRRPSLAYSADDAAQLAGLLAMPIAPSVEAEPEATVEAEPEPAIEPEPEPVLEVEPMEVPPAEEAIEPRVEEEAEASLPDFGEIVDEVPVAEPEVEEQAPPPPEPKKPGFFSRLVWRKSQVKAPPPKVEEKDEEQEETSAVDDFAPADAAADEVVAEVSESTEAVVEDPTPVASYDDVSRWARPTADAEPPDVESAPAPAPFVDARDDFADDPLAKTLETEESGRITEAFDQPVVPEFDEGEKTDEFEAVEAAGADTVEMAEGEAQGLFAKLFARKKALTGTLVEGAPAKTKLELAAEQEGKAPFVLAKFRMFYNEVIRDKHQKSEVISGFATAIVSAAASDLADPEFAAQLLSKRLSEMLELQAAESNWTGGDAVKYYPEAQFAMVALADETFSVIDWPGRPSWHKYMLEPKMYGTRGADVEFFKRVDKLLRDPAPPKGARDLARVYLLVIASGFRGKFRVPNLKRPLAEYRRRLYEFSHLTDPLELYARDRRIFPEAAEQTLAGRAVGRFTPAQKWIGAVVILIVLYATVSHFAWTKLSADLKDVMSRIERSTGSGGSPP